MHTRRALILPALAGLLGLLGCTADSGASSNQPVTADLPAAGETGAPSDPGEAPADSTTVPDGQPVDGVGPAPEDLPADPGRADLPAPVDTPGIDAAPESDASDAREPPAGDTAADLPGGADEGGPDATCGDGVCGPGEDACAEDCGPCGDGVCGRNEWLKACPADCTPECGDELCEPGEVCPFDCPECGDGVCSPGEDCFFDCSSACGDGVCDAFEEMLGCPPDCAKECGDAYCGIEEDVSTCPADCSRCGDGFCTGAETQQACPADCDPWCGDGLCIGTETPASCAPDCGGCGDGVCGHRESHTRCSTDCAAGCGDDECAAGESAESCPADCACEADCDGMECGRDACGGSCGTCPAGGFCDDSGQCSCTFEECGEACCASGEICHEGSCCRPGCAGRSCGPDGCGGSCGECGADAHCVDGSCCTPSCAGRVCGGDGCGGSCGDCPAGKHCEGGACVCDHLSCASTCCGANEVCFEQACCAPACAGRDCGDDACGGSCGECGENATCGAGGSCSCDFVECGEACCAEGAVCHEGACCVPACDGAVCGDDGCGGSCGSCVDGLSCASGRCECDAPVWTRTHGGDKESTIYAVAPDGEGGFLFGGSDKALRTYHDFWVGRVSGEGVRSWTQTGSGGGSFSGDAAYGVIPAGDGGAFACGKRDDGYPKMDQGWARRLDGEGTPLWSKVFGGSGFNVFHAGATTTGGDVVCVGQTFAGTHYRGWWVKLAAADGATMGSGTWASSSAFDVIKGVTPHSGGGYVVTGSRGVQGLDNDDYVSGGSLWLLRVNDSMSPVWSKAFGGASSEGYDVAEAPDGGVLAVGYTNASGAGRRDLFAVRVDAGGAQLWTALWGGAGDDVARAVVAVEGGWLVAGYTEGSGRDLVLVAFDDEGELRWTTTRGGSGTQAAYGLTAVEGEPAHFLVGGRSGSSGLLLKVGLCP